MKLKKYEKSNKEFVKIIQDATENISFSAPLLESSQIEDDS